MGKRVLVIDDSRTVRQQIALLLTDAGFEVIEACDGQEGADKINALSDLDLIICDINMPRMTGLEMLSSLKDHPRKTQLKIVMLTTENRPDLIARAKEKGATGWMIKPFKADLLLAMVRRLTASR
jgi:two-component system chemotaxis response regulator CheY